MKGQLMDLIRNALGKDYEATAEYVGNLIADSLIENGVVVLPCKLGKSLYDISEFKNGVPHAEMYEVEIKGAWIEGNNTVLLDEQANSYSCEALGKTLFRSQEEAEKEVERLRKGKENVWE